MPRVAASTALTAALLLLAMAGLVAAQETEEPLELEVAGKVYQVAPGGTVTVPCPHDPTKTLTIRVGRSLYQSYQGEDFSFEHPAEAPVKDARLAGGLGRAVTFEDSSGATVLVATLDELKTTNTLRELLANRIASAYLGRGVTGKRLEEPAVYFPGVTEPGLQLELDSEPPVLVEIHALQLPAAGRTVAVVLRRPQDAGPGSRARQVIKRFKETFELLPPESEEPEEAPGERRPSPPAGEDDAAGPGDDGR